MDDNFDTSLSEPSSVSESDGVTMPPVLCHLKTVEGGLIDPTGRIQRTNIQLFKFNPDYIITVLSYRARDGEFDCVRMVHQFRLWEDERPNAPYVWDYAKSSSVTLDLGNRQAMRTAILAQRRDSGEEGQMWDCSVSGNNLHFFNGRNAEVNHFDWTGKLLAVNGGGIKFVFDQNPNRDFKEVMLQSDEIDSLKERLEVF